MSEDDQRFTQLMEGHLELTKQVAALTRFLLGFIGDDNKLYPGVASRLAALETKMDVAMRVLGRLGTWGLRLLGFIAVLIMLQYLGIKPPENVLNLLWHLSGQ